jgi:cysteine synthase
MALERLANSTGKYVLMTMPPGLSTSDIEILWGLGARGVVVDMTLEQPEQRLSQIKEAIQKLPTTRKKSKEKFRATLPASIAPPEKAAPEEDEDEEP